MPAESVGFCLRLLERLLLLRTDDRLLAGARSAAGEGVEKAAEAVAGADAEQYESAAHQDREKQVDALHGPAPTAAAKIEEHGL